MHDHGHRWVSSVPVSVWQGAYAHDHVRGGFARRPGQGGPEGGSGIGQGRSAGLSVLAGSRSTTSPSTSSIALSSAGSRVDPGRLDVLDDLLGPGGPDDRRGDVRVLQHPGHPELGHGQARPRRRAGAAAARARACRRCGSRRGSRPTPARWPGSPPAAAGPGRYLPVSTPCAIGVHTIWQSPSSSQVGTTSASMTRQSIEYCGWLDTSGIRSSLASAAAARISSARHSETPM